MNKSDKNFIKNLKREGRKLKSAIPLHDGIHTNYVYDESGNKSYYDAFCFFKSDIFYTVEWTHPRFLYIKKCLNQALDEFDYQFDFDNEESKEKLIDDIEKRRKEIALSGLIVIHPFFLLYSTRTHRIVDCCFPMEILKRNDLIKARNIVERYLDDYRLFLEDHKNYVYDVGSYIEDLKQIDK